MENPFSSVQSIFSLSLCLFLHDDATQETMQTSSSLAAAVRYLGQPPDPLKFSVDQLKSQVDDIASTVASMQTTIHSVRTVTTAFEREFPDVLRQLDILAGQLDREKGDVAVLKEQLAFLANGGGRSRNDGTSESNSTRGLYALLISVVRYLYNPFLYFVHGTYILLSPIVTTMRCLSLFRGNHAKDEISDDDDDTSGALHSGSTLSTAGNRPFKNEVGYLLMALASNGVTKGHHHELTKGSSSAAHAPQLSKTHGGTATDLLTPLPKATPQRGTELYNLLQHTRIDSRTTSSKR